MARKSFLDQMMEIRMADEAKQTRATFQEINNPKPTETPAADIESHTSESAIYTAIGPTLDPANQPTIQPTIQPTSQPANQQTNEPTTQQAEQQAGKLAILSSTRPAKHPSNGGASPWEAPRALRGLRRNDLTILNHIVERVPLTTTVKDISASTGIPIGTTRNCLEKLKERNFLTWNRTYDGCAFGTSYTVFDHTLTLCDAHKNFILQSINGGQNNHNAQQSTQQYTQQTTEKRQGQATQQTILPTNPSLDRKIKENLSILEELEKEAKRLYQLDDDDMQMFLPDLYRAGFTAVNVRSLIERRHKNGLDLSDPTVKMIHMGMRRADAALRIGEGTFKGTINTPIENVPGYVFSTLLKDASFPKPSAWEPEEVVAQQLELERLRQEAERQRLESEMRNKIEASAKAEREEQDYQAWRNALTPEEIAAYRDRCPNKKSEESLERFLRVEWRKTLG